MTENFIREIRISFKLSPEEKVHVEWFTISNFDGIYLIWNGLRYYKPTVKSPYEYFTSVTGIHSKEISLKLFSQWWEVNKQNQKNDRL